MRLAAFVLTLLLGLGVAEIALRIAWTKKRPPGSHSWHDYDARLGWRNKRSFRTIVDKVPNVEKLEVPFEVRLNAQGLREDRDMAPESSAGVFRIACVGDSYTFGYRIPGEAAYPRRLEAALGPGFEVWNWGVCAYGLDQFVLALDDVLASKPRLVVLGVIEQSFRRATNMHFMDGTAKPRFYLEGGDLVLTNVPVPVVNPGDTFCRFDVRGSSYVAAGIARVVQNIRIGLAHDPEAATEDWLLGRALIRDAARRCRERGIRLAVALLPEGQLMESDRYERLLPTLEPEGVPILDTYPAFMARAKDPRPLFIPEDGHPNELGCEVMAEAIAKELRARGLLER
jgi:hypothetical protein